MRKFFTIAVLSLLINHHLSSQEIQNLETPFVRKCSIRMTVIECGGQSGLTSKKINQSGDLLKAYCGSNSRGLISAFLGFGLCYNGKIELGVIPFTATLSNDGVAFQDYLRDNYNGYYVDDVWVRRNREITGLGFYSSYRFRLKFFQWEWRFQFHPNSYKTDQKSFRLKEVGSNQFLSYSIKEEIIRNNHSYQLATGICRPFTSTNTNFGIEMGVNTGIILSPIKSVFTFTTTPYGGAESEQVITVFSTNPTFFVTARLRILFGSYEERSSRPGYDDGYLKRIN